MSARVRAGVLAVVAALIMSACGDDGPPIVFAGQAVEVVGEDNLFDVTTVEARVGEALTFVFDHRDEGTNHNFRVDDTAEGTMKTPIVLGPVTQTLEVTFDEPGEYEYWCEVHPDHMRGTVVVTA